MCSHLLSLCGGEQLLCVQSRDNTSFARLAGLCKAMDDHSKGIVGDLQAKLSFGKSVHLGTIDKYLRMQYIAKLEMVENDAIMKDKWKKWLPRWSKQKPWMSATN